MRRREALWKTINIQQKLSQAQMSTYFYWLKIITGKWFKS
jgi:hypothetical protein